MKHTQSNFLKSGCAIDLVLLAALWCIAVIIVNPIGEFPLNDDWSYALTVKYLGEHLDFRPCGWTCMPFITQALWGALFCLPRGFSFTALRFSTLTLSLAGVLGFYILMRQVGSSRRFALMCALVLAFNPIYFALSNSFMTDVPFTTLAIFSIFFFVRYFQTESTPSLVIAVVLAIITTLCRQLGLALPLAFTATVFLKYGFQKSRVALALAPSLLTGIIWVGFNHWMKVTGRTPAIYNKETNKLLLILSKPWTVPLHLAHHGWNALMYTGCFLLPLLILFLPAKRQLFSRKTIKVAIGFFVLWSGARFIFKPGLMPVHGNILDPHGIGPLLLQDAQLLSLPHVIPLPVAFWFIVTLLSLAGAAILISLTLLSDFFSPAQAEIADCGQLKRSWLFSKWPIKDRLQSVNTTVGVFFLFCALIYLAPLVINGFFDRYFITVIVFVAGFLATMLPVAEWPARRWQWIAAIVLLTCSALYAVAGTRDYLAWNRVRWIALADLQQNHIPPEKIDGGLEFNGWYLYDPKYQPGGDKSDWWVIDNQYLVSFGDMPGFAEIKEYDYARWLPPSRGKIVVLKKTSNQSASK
ncbi:MAG TPA: glycosyltransferase family 39 protein [Verrucomicrobiae bacterium]|nr:glycosyltransferase family 39 protein [Verrucomicrobiae bacterium]